jgi:hypothetical protein
MVCIVVLTILLALSPSNYLIPKAVAQKDNPGKTTSPTQFGQPATDSVYTSIMGPKTSAHNSINLNKGTGSPRNPTNNPESLIGSFLDPKVLLASAIDQIRNSTASSVSSNASNPTSTMFVRNYDTVLLARQIILPKDFIPLFDDPPYIVMDGQVSAKLPCNSNSTSPLQIFIAKISVGQTPVLKPVQLQPVSGLSKPGYMCVYRGNLQSITATNTTGASYGAKISLLNPTDHLVMLPDTSSIAIGFNEIIPSAHHHPNNKSPT